MDVPTFEPSRIVKVSPLFPWPPEKRANSAVGMARTRRSALEEVDEVTPTAVMLPSKVLR